MTAWEGLTPPYATIVADPPWPYNEDRPNGWGDRRRRSLLPYSSMSLEDIASLSVDDLAAPDAHLFVWSTNRFLEATYGIIRAWGFTPATTLVWCKPRRGLGLGNASFAITTEFIIHGRRGKPAAANRAESTWWEWQRSAHSEKPPAFLDLIEAGCPGPYVELFCRQPRFGWDSWGWGYEQAVGW